MSCRTEKTLLPLRSKDIFTPIRIAVDKNGIEEKVDPGLGTDGPARSFIRSVSRMP